MVRQSIPPPIEVFPQMIVAPNDSLCTCLYSVVVAQYIGCCTSCSLCKLASFDKVTKLLQTDRTTVSRCSRMHSLNSFDCVDVIATLDHSHQKRLSAAWFVEAYQRVFPPSMDAAVLDLLVADTTGVTFCALALGIVRSDVRAHPPAPLRHTCIRVR